MGTQACECTGLCAICSHMGDMCAHVTVCTVTAHEHVWYLCPCMAGGSLEAVLCYDMFFCCYDMSLSSTELPVGLVCVWGGVFQYRGEPGMEPDKGAPGPSLQSGFAIPLAPPSAPWCLCRSLSLTEGLGLCLCPFSSVSMRRGESNSL